MVRKKVKLQHIASDPVRRATLKKRKKGLMKKVSELSTLCDVNACAIIYSPNNPVPEVWPPSALEAHRVLTRFQSLPDMEQSKKMMNQEGFLRQRLTKVKDQVKKQQRENKENFISYLMFQALTGNVDLQDLGLCDLNELTWLLEQTIIGVTERINCLKEEQQQNPQQAQDLQQMQDQQQQALDQLQQVIQQARYNQQAHEQQQQTQDQQQQAHNHEQIQDEQEVHYQLVQQQVHFERVRYQQQRQHQQQIQDDQQQGQQQVHYQPQQQALYQHAHYQQATRYQAQQQEQQSTISTAFTLLTGGQDQVVNNNMVAGLNVTVEATGRQSWFLDVPNPDLPPLPPSLLHENQLVMTQQEHNQISYMNNYATATGPNDHMATMMPSLFGDVNTSSQSSTSFLP